MTTYDETAIIERVLEEPAGLFDGAPHAAPDDTPTARAVAKVTTAVDIVYTEITPLDTSELRDGIGLVNYAGTEARLATLRGLYQGKRFDLTTPEGDAMAREGSKKLLKLRTGLEATRKGFKAPSLAHGKLIDSEAERITLEIKALETQVNDQIAAEDARLAEIKAEADRLAAIAKAEAERIEAERVAGFEADIANILIFVERCTGLTSERIAKGIAMVEDLAFGDEWADFAERAAIAQAETLAAMRAMYNTALAAEVLEAQAAEQRAELARVAEAQAAEAARLKAMADKMAEQQAELDRQRAELAAAEATRLEAIRIAEEKERARLAAEKAQADAAAAAILAAAKAEIEAAAARAAAAEEAARADAQAAVDAQLAADAAVVAAAEAEAAAVDAARAADDLAVIAAAEAAEAAAIAEAQAVIALGETISAAFDEALLEDAARTDARIAGDKAAEAAAQTAIEECNERASTAMRSYRSAPRVQDVVVTAAVAPGADILPPLSIGAICERLGCGIKITAAGLETLGFLPLESKGSAVLFSAGEWPALKLALIAHIGSLA